jgi:hypothetical protein
MVNIGVLSKGEKEKEVGAAEEGSGGGCREEEKGET